jgi:hypothetical protein
MKKKETTNHFRIDTIAFLHELADKGLVKNMGVVKVPLNILRNLLGQIAQRSVELNDPVLNRIMFDMALYELPTPTTPEYSELMEKVYKMEKMQLEHERFQKNILKNNLQNT